MENDNRNVNYESSFSLHSKITKRRRRLSRLSLRKHFRKSLKYDRVESTIPNKSLSIIEKSSTDSIEIISINSSGHSDCEDIITPSPNKNNSKIKCLSNKKIKYDIIKQNNNKIPLQNVKSIEEKGEASDYKVEYVMDTKAFLEFSLLDYENFQKPRIISNDVMNSTMVMPRVKPKNNIPGCKESETVDNSDVDLESAEYCEDVLDDIYGDSWRPFREKVLPKSERKPCNKQINNEKKCPASERIAKKSEVKKNEHVMNGNYKPNNLLKMLHLKKTEEAMQSPFMRDLKLLCDEENSKINNVPITIRTKLNFDDNDKLKPGDEEKLERKDISIFDDFSALADEKLSLKERLEKKMLKEKNIIECKEPPKKENPKFIGLTSEENDFNINTNEKVDRPKKVSNRTILNQNHQDTPSSSDDSFKNVIGINKGKKKVPKTYLKKYLDDSSSGGSSDEVEEFDKIVPKTLNKKSKIGDNPKSDQNIKKKQGTECDSLSSEDSNRADDYVKSTVNKKGLKTRTNQKNSSEDSKKSNIGGIPNSDRNVGKKFAKETKYFSLSNEDSDSADDYVKNIVNKKGPKIKTNHKYLSDDSEVSPVEVKNKNSTKKVNSTNTYSFLASLSRNVPDHKCDPTAKVFKANFKNNKEELTSKLFALFNKNIFNDLLPKDTALEWNARMLSTAGYCYSKRITHSDGKIDLMARIVLSSKVLTTPDRLRDTLIHEMCHAATWIIDNMRDGHGRYWKAWATKAKEVYPELPPIKTCHNYEIQSKYIYRCTGCGYSIKRHRKSLDIERKRCGYCMGKFEIFINKVNKKGENELKPIDTPKKQPKGFALFVKENYYKYKNTNSAEVMKLLSKEFNKMKVQ